MSRPSEALFNEVRLLYQSLVQVSAELHAGSNVSLGMRAVLEYLDRNGDTTVPQIARARRVTRQRIQTLVNELLAENLVESTSNPASKRSPLITLTDTGAKTILEMRRLEGREMHIPISDQKIRAATTTLAQVREAIEAGRTSAGLDQVQAR